MLSGFQPSFRVLGVWEQRWMLSAAAISSDFSQRRPETWKRSPSASSQTQLLLYVHFTKLEKPLGEAIREFNGALSPDSSFFRQGEFPDKTGCGICKSSIEVSVNLLVDRNKFNTIDPRFSGFKLFFKICSCS